MNVQDLVAVVQRLEDRGAEQEALRITMAEISTSLADLLALLERSGAETAKAIAEGLKNVRLGQINVPAPVVHTEAAPQVAWEFTHETNRDGVIVKSVARPINNKVG